MREFSGKVAVVTGAASGIGRGLAERFAQEGMKVVLADVEEIVLNDTAAAIRSSGAEVLAVPTDVSRRDDVENLAQRTLDAFGAVHIVCNNAGVGSPGVPAWEATERDWQWVLGVNLWGVIHGVRAFLPIMLRQDAEGHLVNTASLAGHVSMPMLSPYSVSKFAVIALSESIHYELAMTGAKVKVSALCPGWVNTRIIDAERNRPAALQNQPGQQTPNTPAQAMARQLLASGMSPADVADHVVQAIREERFYILTHPQMKPLIESRFNAILDGRNPEFRGFA